MNIVSFDVVKFYHKFHNFQYMEVTNPEQWLWAEINSIYQPIMKK